MLEAAQVIFERRTGLPMDVYDIAADAARMTAHSLFIWSESDAVVPPKATQSLADSWPNSRRSGVTGPDHRRVVRHPDVVRQAVEFLS